LGWKKREGEGGVGLTRLASGSRQASATTGESDTFLGDTTTGFRCCCLRVKKEVVAATSVPLQEDELEPTCAQPPGANDPRAALPLERRAEAAVAADAAIAAAISNPTTQLKRNPNLQCGDGD
jgi:hypothetical protein